MTISDPDLMRDLEGQSLPSEIPIIEAARVIFTPDKDEDENSGEHGTQEHCTQECRTWKHNSQDIMKIIQACLKEAKKQSTT